MRPRAPCCARRTRPAASCRTPKLHQDAAKVAVNEAAGRIELAARSALAAMADGDVLRTQLAALRRLLKITPVNTVVLRRRLADADRQQGRLHLLGDG